MGFCAEFINITLPYGYEFFECYTLLLFFLRSFIAVMAKNNPTEKQIDVEARSGDAEAWESMKTLRRV